MQRPSVSVRVVYPITLPHFCSHDIMGTDIWSQDDYGDGYGTMLSQKHPGNPIKLIFPITLLVVQLNVDMGNFLGSGSDFAKVLQLFQSSRGRAHPPAGELISSWCVAAPSLQELDCVSRLHGF